MSIIITWPECHKIAQRRSLMYNHPTVLFSSRDLTPKTPLQCFQLLMPISSYRIVSYHNQVQAPADLFISSPQRTEHRNPPTASTSSSARLWYLHFGCERVILRDGKNGHVVRRGVQLVWVRWICHSRIYCRLVSVCPAGEECWDEHTLENRSWRWLIWYRESMKACLRWLR